MAKSWNIIKLKKKVDLFCLWDYFKRRMQRRLCFAFFYENME